MSKERSPNFQEVQISAFLPIPTLNQVGACLLRQAGRLNPNMKKSCQMRATIRGCISGKRSPVI